MGAASCPVLEPSGASSRALEVPDRLLTMRDPAGERKTRELEREWAVKTPAIRGFIFNALFSSATPNRTQPVFNALNHSTTLSGSPLCRVTCLMLVAQAPEMLLRHG
jgi:hypothetical protein